MKAPFAFCVAMTCAVAQFRAPYTAKPAPPISFDESPRLSGLLRAGSLYLSLPDAIALGLESNLDVEFERLVPRMAASDLLRTQGGGTPRGISMSVSELPSGIGGPAAPLINVAASGSLGSSSVPSGSSVLETITPSESGIAITGASGFSPGPPVPPFDPFLTSSLQYQHQNTPISETNSGTATSVRDQSWSGDLGVQKGFSTGTVAGLDLNALRQDTNSALSRFGTSTSSSLGLNFTQPLLRGFGVQMNRRFIRIAKNNQKTTDLVFRQQAIATVAGVIRLYYDLVSLTSDVKVKEQTLQVAQQLQENNRVSVEQGTLAPVELTRAQAQVAAARQDLANARGLERQQEMILKSVLTRNGMADPSVRNAKLILTSSIEIPTSESPRPVQDLVGEALDKRPELEEARLQVKNSNISLSGSRNELLPELDLVANAQNVGLAGRPNSVALAGGPTVQPNDALNGGLGTGLSQVFSGKYPSFTVGLQLTLPLRNRVAQADVARDELQIRQWEIRYRQLELQVRLEVENAAIALEQARTAYDAAVEARTLQEQSLAIETERFTSGISTTFLVLQYQSFVDQARSTEVAAAGVYAKARTSLERALGQILENHNVDITEAYRGQIAREVR